MILVRRKPLLDQWIAQIAFFLEHFAERLKTFTKHLVILHGGMKPSERKKALSRCAGIPMGEERGLLATGRFLGKGFDDARLDTLFLTLPVSWKGTLVQYTGRLHRIHSGKEEVTVYDYVDEKVPVLRRMFDKRLRGYRSIGYGFETSSRQRKPQSV